MQPFTKALIGLATFLHVVTALPVRAADPIRLGALLPMTGPNAKGGLEDWTAMEIARDMINEKGGVNGRPVEYVRGDIVTPTAAISETDRLITKEGIKITTGSYASPMRSPSAASNTPFSWARRRPATAGRRLISAVTCWPQG